MKEFENCAPALLGEVVSAAMHFGEPALTGCDPS
jgi:hypothetical protein